MTENENLIGIKECIQITAKVLDYLKVGFLVFFVEDLTDEKSVNFVFANASANEVAKTDLRRIFGKPAHEAFPNMKQRDLQDYVKVAGQKVSHIDDLAPYGDQNVKTAMFKSKIVHLYDRYVGLIFSDVTAYMI